MQLLSSALEVNFQAKNGITVRLPTINFICPKSMTTWFEARSLVLDVGRRFAVRIQYYMAAYLFFVGLGILFSFACAAGYINWKYLKPVQWICFSLTLFVFASYCLSIMWPYSYVNEQSKYQLKRIINLRSVLMRLLRDNRMLISNARRVRNLVLRKSLVHL